MKRIRPLVAAAAALAVAPGIALLPALTSATPASAATYCTGTSLISDRLGLFEVRVPTIGNGTGDDDCQLALGNDSVAVARLQIALNECNSAAFSPPLAVDSDYGTLTQEAVRKVQAYWGASVDGGLGRLR